ncbi:hypothetical protein [Paraburkholderia sp. CI3]|uniref:hypothetical protein n=1 Tax=Paraburkholderia sp. CI3 TaxID=2991060 RepID=UPI003D1C404B
MKKHRCESVDHAAFGNADDSSAATRANAVQLDEHEPAQRRFMQLASTASAGFVQPPVNHGNIDSADCVLGFAVVKKTPWHFGGIYAQEDDAKRVARSLGVGYEVHYGYHRFNPDDLFY